MNYPIATDATARLRIDKWLWCARFFKTRSLAAEAVNKNRVRLDGEPCKVAKEVRVGDRIVIEIERNRWEIQVLAICAVRGPAVVAQTLYAETTESQARRELETARRKTFREPSEALAGRPTKRDRRVIDRFSGGD